MANNALDIDEGRLREMIIEHNKGVTQKEAYKILQVVKDENKKKSWQNTNSLTRQNV